jgi:hypothetical protein
MFVACGSLRGVRPELKPTVAAVVTDPDGIFMIRDTVAVDIAHVVLIHMTDRGVVVEVSAAPVATFVAVAAVAVAIVNPAVEADVRTPVATAPTVVAAGIAPVPRRP